MCSHFFYYHAAPMHPIRTTVMFLLTLSAKFLQDRGGVLGLSASPVGTSCLWWSSARVCGRMEWMHYPEETASSSFLGVWGLVSLDPITGKDLYEMLGSAWKRRNSGRRSLSSEEVFRAEVTHPSGPQLTAQGHATALLHWWVCVYSTWVV